MDNTVPLTPILNRNGNDPWYHLVPRGEFAHSESGTMQVLDDAALVSLVNRFKAASAAPGFAGLLIDQEHFSYDPGKSSEAYGWIKEVENRDSGLWGRVEWTDLGQSALANKRYKFLSPVWLKPDVEILPNKRIRPLRLDTVGLTNNPNLRGMVPLVNRSGASGAHSEKPKHMKSVAQALGLALEASEEACLAAVNALKNRAESAERDLTPFKNRAEKAEGDLKALRDSTAASDLEPYKNRIAPGSEDFWKSCLATNRDQALANLKKLGDSSAAGGSQQILNRAAAKPPAGGASDADASRTAAEAARSQKIANRAAEIGKTNPRLTFSQCWAQAQGEFPEV